MKIKRIWRGDYIHGHFTKARDVNGEVFSKNPGDLDQQDLAFPFYYEHVNEAVAAAKTGFRTWKRMASSDRYEAVRKYRDLFLERTEDTSRCLSFEVGKPLWEAREEINDTLSLIDYFLSQPSPTREENKVELSEQSEVEGSYRYLPRGVMAVISPSTMPIYITHAYFIPSLLNGNTVVIKSSKFAPASSQHIAEIANDAALPGGTVNLLHGNSELSRRLVTHKEVQGVFFSGSYEKCLRIKKELVSDYCKTAVLETGGKNGTIIWEDCNYKKALHETLYASLTTAGQRYTSNQRILIHDKLFDKFVSDFHTLAKKCPIGYGLTEGDKAPFMGPLVSENKMQNYLRYQGIAVREGCEEVMRGKALERKKRGYYVSPSIHIISKLNPKSIYQKDEIYGPNVAIYRIGDLDEGIAILNDSTYGLVGSIYTEKRAVFLQLLEEAEVGLLYRNCPTIRPCFKLPRAGMKKSGSHRPMGSLSATQCTYPVSSVEWTGPSELPTIPAQMPRIE